MSPIMREQVDKVNQQLDGPATAPALATKATKATKGTKCNKDTTGTTGTCHGRH
jgi:hypothetical protein